MLREHGITPTHQRMEIAQVLFDRPAHLSADQILAMVNARHAETSKATVYNTLRLFFAGGMTLHPFAPAYAGRCPAKPVALPVARYQASFRENVINGRHEIVTLGPIERIIIQFLDGTHTPESLVAPVSAQLVKQGLSLLHDGQRFANQAEMERALAAHCGRALQAFAAQALIQA